MDVPVGTVKSGLHRAVEELKPLIVEASESARSPNYWWAAALAFGLPPYWTRAALAEAFTFTTKGPRTTGSSVRQLEQGIRGVTDSPENQAWALPPLQAPRRLAEDAAQIIREQILAGRFRPGERLVEAKIAQQLNVSRGPVREAFKMLRSEGFIEEEPRRGTFVARIDGSDVLEVYDLRAAIESRAALVLARSAEEQKLAELRRVIGDLQDAAKAEDSRAVSRADLAFHESVCRLSGNSRLYEVFDRYVPLIRALLPIDEHLFRVPREIVDQHLPMLAAIEAKDAELAARLFAEHCEQARDLVMEYLSQQR
jgi:DNA-binding GntR family transcriptional regulator